MAILVDAACFFHLIYFFAFFVCHHCLIMLHRLATKVSKTLHQNLQGSTMTVHKCTWCKIIIAAKK